MSGRIGESRANAGVGEVALATGVVAGLRAIGPTMTNRMLIPKPALGGIAIAGGLAVGAAGEGAARGLDAATGLDRRESHLAIAGAGAGATLVGWRLSSNPAKIIGSTGRVLAVTAALGVGLDRAHDRYDKDGNGHFFPEVPRSVELGIAGVAVAGIVIAGGPRAVRAIKGTNKIARPSEQARAAMDAAGAKLGELIRRSDLTSSPRTFIAARIEHGFGPDAIRTVAPHELDDAKLRASFGFPETGALVHDQLAEIGVKSFVNQGATAVDDTGRTLVRQVLIGSPTGMGGLNVAPIMTIEQLARTATIDAQYGALPSIKSLDKVDEAIDKFVAVARRTRDLYAPMPEELRPKLNGVATSLGGLQFDALIAKYGHGIVDELGLNKIVTLGAPSDLSKLDRSKLPEGFHIRATFEEFTALPQEQIDRARFIELRHNDDPVALMAKNILWRKPPWFPKDRTWVPGLSMGQHIMDVLVSIQRGTGSKLTKGGHDYRMAKSNEAFARALDVRAPDGSAIPEEALHTAAVRAQDAAVNKHKLLRDTITGAKPAGAPPAAA